MGMGEIMDFTAGGWGGKCLKIGEFFRFDKRAWLRYNKSEGGESCYSM